MLTLASSVLPPLQATVWGERQPPWVRREGEHGEEATESEQRGASVASPDQPPHVPCLLPAAPLLLHLPRPLIPVVLLLTCGRVRLPHPLLRLPPAGPILLPVPQSRRQSKSLPGTSHTHSQGSKQSELLPRSGHAHTPSVSQSLQLSLSQLFAEISSHLSLFSLS